MNSGFLLNRVLSINRSSYTLQVRLALALKYSLIVSFSNPHNPTLIKNTRGLLIERALGIPKGRQQRHQRPAQGAAAGGGNACQV